MPPWAGRPGFHLDGAFGARGDVQESRAQLCFLSKPEKGFDRELFVWCPRTFLFFTFVLSMQ